MKKDIACLRVLLDRTWNPVDERDKKEDMEGGGWMNLVQGLVFEAVVGEMINMRRDIAALK